MEILAHRTAMANAPPNSLAGLQFCWEHGINVAECDASFTADDQAIIWHNHDNHLLVKPVRSIQNHTLLEMLMLERRDCRERLMQLSDIWNFLASHPGFTVVFDIKYYNSDLGGITNLIHTRLICLAMRLIVEPAVKMGFNRQIGFVTFRGGNELLAEARARKIFVTSMVIWPFSKNNVCIHSQFVDAITIGWGLGNLNHWWLLSENKLERLFRNIRANGCRLWGGLANKSEQIEWLQYWGFDGAWTDDIVMAKEVLTSEI